MVHVQHLREGRRVLDRLVDFDRERGIVRSRNGPADKQVPVSIPASRDARDPVSTLFYIRTLPLETVGRVRVPVSDLGRNLIVEFQAAPDAMTYGGRRVDVWRVEPRLEYRLARRTTPTAVVWVSRDARRIPLAFTVDAPFGSFRAELVSYSPGGPPAAAGVR